MIKHTIILGHGSGDPGAIGDRGRTERDELEKFGKRLKETIKSYGLPIQVIDDHNVLRKGNVVKYKGTSVTELHFNAFNKAAIGTEVLIKQGLKPDAMDKRLLDAMGLYFKSRGFKYRNDLGNMNKSATNGVNYRLVEICFIDNVGDMQVYDRHVGQIVISLLKAITGQALPAPKTIAPAKPVKKFYVQTGAFTVELNAREHLKEVRKTYPDAFIREG